MFSLSIVNSIADVIIVSTIFYQCYVREKFATCTSNHICSYITRTLCPTTHHCQFDHSCKGQHVLTLMVTAMTATMMMTGSECGRVIAPPMVAPRRVWTRTAHRLTNASSPATTNTNQDFSHRHHHYHHHSPLL